MTWAKALAQPAREFDITPLRVLAGEIPAGLRGTLYRNGPGRLERAGMRVGHWFDGDGAVLAVNFNDQQATATYRYVQTAGYQAEAKADRLLFGGYGMTVPGPWWQRWLHGTKNAANTSVLCLEDQLWTLWEGGAPHALDPLTLATLGPINFPDPYSAHPKRDGQAIYNFGLSYGPQGKLTIYRSNLKGQIEQQTTITLTGLPLVHDFALAGNYLVFFLPPLAMAAFPVLARLKSPSEAFQWQPQRGTMILILDKNSLEVVTRIETEPWFQWHFGNGYQDRDMIVVDLIRYEDFKSNQFLQEVATGTTDTIAPSIFWRIRLDPKKGRVLATETLLDRSCEFPSVAPTQVGQVHTHSYLNLHRSESDVGQELFSSIGRYDHQNNQLTVADCDGYPSEPIYAEGWILTVVFDGAVSSLWIFDGAALEAGPVCRLALPGIIPPSFHGTWQAAP